MLYIVVQYVILQYWNLKKKKSKLRWCVYERTVNDNIILNYNFTFPYDDHKLDIVTSMVLRFSARWIVSRARRIDRRQAVAEETRAVWVGSGCELSTRPFVLASFRNIIRCNLRTVAFVQVLIKSQMPFYNLRVVISAIQACTFTRTGDSVMCSE